MCAVLVEYALILVLVRIAAAAGRCHARRPGRFEMCACMTRQQLSESLVTQARQRAARIMTDRRVRAVQARLVQRVQQGHAIMATMSTSWR